MFHVEQKGGYLPPFSFILIIIYAQNVYIIQVKITNILAFSFRKCNLKKPFQQSL